MSTDFARTLSLLRKEKGISQRSAAADLGVAQALLSHYENGAREPGFAFLVKVSDYYKVSADYLLGRTMTRDGTAINAEDLPDEAQNKDHRLRSGVSASSLLAKKLIINSISLLFDLVGRSGHRSLISELASVLGTTVYKLFRQVYNSAGGNSENFFATPASRFPYSANADIAISEGKIQNILSRAKEDKGDAVDLPQISHETLTREYPMLVQSLLTVVHQASEREKKL